MQETRRRILEALADGPVGGPTLATDLDVSRAAVWKHVEAIREAGFEVESGPKGYRLVSVPTYGGTAVEFGLEAPFDVEYHDAIDSTNRRARELAADGADGVVVLADEQTGGRGRLDRSWASPSGGIWLSVVSRPSVPPAHAPAFTLAMAVAITDAAREAGVEAEIKWPNDVVVGSDRKLAGVLTEMAAEADRIGWLVVGAGVNANVDQDTLPRDANPTSLRAEVGDVNRRAFTQRVLEGYDEARGDLRSTVDRAREHSATLGRRVRVETPSETVEGQAVDLTFPGSLVVETAEGERTVAAGDCEHLRPVDA